MACTVTTLTLLLKIFWVIIRHHFLVQMGQTSDTETLVMHQKMMPGNNPEDFKQHYNHGGGSLQLQL
jgi:hypothetical protein